MATQHKGKAIIIIDLRAKDAFSGFLANKVKEYVYNAFQYTHLKVHNFGI